MDEEIDLLLQQIHQILQIGDFVLQFRLPRAHGSLLILDLLDRCLHLFNFLVGLVRLPIYVVHLPSQLLQLRDHHGDRIGWRHHVSETNLKTGQVRVRRIQVEVTRIRALITKCHTLLYLDSVLRIYGRVVSGTG